MNTGSCIQTIELLRRLALNVHGVIDAVDDRNCDEIISLLKEQEPVKPIRMHHSQHKQTDNYRCGKCGDDIYFEQRFCECCGQAAKWDE